MKNLKKSVAILGALGIFATSTAAYAVVARTPADILSGLTGKTTTQLSTERASSKTYGTIAKEAGKLSEFQAQMLVEKKAVLDQRVKDKTLTKAQADAIYNSIKTNQATCNGNGAAAIGRNNSLMLGQGMGMRNGNCTGTDSGMRNGRGMGFGRGHR